MNISVSGKESITFFEVLILGDRRIIMAYTDEQKRLARRKNLLVFCEREGYQLKSEGNGNYRLPNHGGLIIRDNYYYKNSTREKGSAIDFCVEVLGLDFKEAVEKLLECPTIEEDEYPFTRKRVKAEQERKFALPKSSARDAIFTYLRHHRHLPMGLIREVIDKGLLYQDEHSNCVFPCNDVSGVSKGAIIRGTEKDNPFKRRSVGSDASYGWILPPNQTSNKVIVFEAPIDALSFFVPYPTARDSNILALGGLNMSTLETFLSENIQVTEIIMALDNDKPARDMIEKFKDENGSVYLVKEFLPISGKDWNEQLVRPSA